ncbi:MAG: hypothetical protein JWR63_2488, partial [Conexibacter sp.]|nr:hypothetical protein [Conexibacter sp.]
MGSLPQTTPLGPLPDTIATLC